MPEHDLDAAIEAAARAAYEHSQAKRPPSWWNGWDAVADSHKEELRSYARRHIVAALPYLQDQGLRELHGWVKGQVFACLNEPLVGGAPDIMVRKAQAQAFRAVQSEIERRIGEGWK